MNVTVIGAGFVGLSLSIAMSYLGNHVMCIDKDAEKINQLKNDGCFTDEYGIDELISILPVCFAESVTNSEESINQADIVFICVDTPMKEDGKADITHVMDVANELGNVLNPSHDMTIVLKSTVPCTTTDLFSSVLKEQIKKSGHSIANSLIHVAHNPEFMREGCALADMLMPYRIIIGTRDDVAARMIERLYSPILTQKFSMPNVLCFTRERRNPKLMMTDPVTSELIKYASNAFLALKISYANEISILAKAYGADMRDISDGMGMDDRIAPYFLNAGLGWGGSCFPKDTKALVSMGLEQGCSMKITRAAIDVNEQQKARLVMILTNRLEDLHEKKIVILGITFKPGTDDVRNSPAADVAIMLKSLGADIHVHDCRGLENAKREYREYGFAFDDDVENIVQDAYAVVIATDWKAYVTLPWRKMRDRMRYPLLVDARYLMQNERQRLDGWIYVTL